MLLGAWLNCTWRQQQQWKFTVQQLLFTPKLKNLKLWSHQTTNHLGLVWATILTCHRKQTLTLTSELLKQTHMQQEWCQQVVSLQLVDRRCWGWMGRRDVCQICRIFDIKILVLWWKNLAVSTPSWAVLHREQKPVGSGGETRRNAAASLHSGTFSFTSPLRAAWRSSASIRQFHLVSLLLFAAV